MVGGQTTTGPLCRAVEDSGGKTEHSAASDRSLCLLQCCRSAVGLVVVVGVSCCWFCSLSRHLLASVYFCLDWWCGLSVLCGHKSWLLDKIPGRSLLSDFIKRSPQQVLQEHRRPQLGSVTEETSVDLNQTLTGSSSVPVAANVMFIDATSYLWSISECRVFEVVIFNACRWFDHVKRAKRRFLLPLFWVVTFFRVFWWEGNVRNQPPGRPLLGRAFFTCVVFLQCQSHQYTTQHIVITLRIFENTEIIRIKTAAVLN